jgi:hypothetical protein
MAVILETVPLGAARRKGQDGIQTIKIDNEPFVEALSMEHMETPGPDDPSRVCKSVCI